MTASAQPSFISAQASRASRNSLIANGVVLATMAALAWLCGPYYYYFFFGPFPLSDVDLQRLAQSSGELLSYAVLENRQLLPTEWDEVVTKDDRLHERSSYFLTPVGERFLLVLAKTPADGERLVGPVYPLGARESEVAVKTIDARPELIGRIMPIMLNNTAAFTVAGYLGLTVFLPTLLVCSFNVSQACLARVHPLRHPFVRRLQRYGVPDSLAEQIDAEMQAGPLMRFGKSILTRLWLLRPTLFGLTTVPLVELVWIYQVQKTTESFAVLSLTDGRQMIVLLKPAQVEELIAEIRSRIPWAITGYSKERLQAWQKNRSAMIGEVLQKRQLSLNGF